MLRLLLLFPITLFAASDYGASATETLDTRYLPAPPPPFQGTINLNAYDSTPAWPPQITPAKEAPNILLIMTDDVGFAAPSTFGGIIPTPTLDRIAAMGLRYTQFHSTALCSPTRAALITGRNHHSAHTGVVAEQATGFPGYDTIIGKDTASIGEILKLNGFSTSWFGKNHNTPDWQATLLGPFDNWPIGYGFQYFYGFVGGDTSQWQPNLYRNTTPIEPFLNKPSWNLITAMADDAISYLNQMNAINPDQKFFVYYVPGGTHAPHHPPKEWIEKFKGKFDQGYEKVREEIFQNQLRLGVIPKNSKLTPWPDSIPKWDTLTETEKKLFAHQAEVYAAYLAYTDHEIGQVVKTIEDMGKLDNTLIIYISGDNGSSAEGSLVGTPNEVAVFNGVIVPPEKQMAFFDVWGSDLTYPHMAVGWTWVFDTPFQWTKQVASHFGGTRQGMCISWPNRIKDKGGIRTQFHHVIDIVPTLLEAAKIPEPVQVNGIWQKPIEGVSLSYTWDKENKDVPSKRKTQYFEMFGNRAIYHDGWVATTTPIAPPWEMGLGKLPKDVMNDYKWELYNLTDDPTQFNNIVKERPDKLKELQEEFIRQAEKYNVFPLDNSVVTRLSALRPRLGPARNDYVYTSEILNIPHGSAPSILNRSWSAKADIEVEDKANGILVTQGGRFGGYGFYLLEGKPVFLYNILDLERVRVEGKEPLSKGKHVVEFQFTYKGPGLGKGGTGVVLVDGKEAARTEFEHTIPFIFQWDESFNVGADTGTPVEDKDYKVPFRFEGKLERLVIHLEPIQASDEEKQTLDVKGRANNQASE